MGMTIRLAIMHAIYRCVVMTIRFDIMQDISSSAFGSKSNSRGSSSFLLSNIGTTMGEVPRGHSAAVKPLDDQGRENGQ